uniref:Macrophage migration inhibitory factor-like protein n=1 Tax=Mytilus galloprovincialis TaxID=29158 RepID=A0A3R5SUI1_MYTGA|nr:macrophage migration inhibitory factor-like protein [Mytilus galloprovincialis]
MVIVVIHTSLKDEELPEKFEETVSKMLADLMDYPVEVYYCIVNTAARIWHDGNYDPFVYVDVITNNRFNDKTNPKYMNPIMQFFRDFMKLPINRVLAQLHECPLSSLGWHRLAPHYAAEKFFRDATIQH